MVKSRLSRKSHVSINNIWENNSFVKSVYGNLATIVENEHVNSIKVDHDCVRFKTMGRCSFLYAVEQHIQRITELSLETYSSS